MCVMNNTLSVPFKTVNVVETDKWRMEEWPRGRHLTVDFYGFINSLEDNAVVVNDLLTTSSLWQSFIQLFRLKLETGKNNHHKSF